MVDIMTESERHGSQLEAENKKQKELILHYEALLLHHGIQPGATPVPPHAHAPATEMTTATATTTTTAEALDFECVINEEPPGKESS